MRGWSRKRSGRFTPGCEGALLLYDYSVPEGRSAEVRKNSTPQVFDPRTDHPAAFRYTDLSILAHISFLFFL